VEGLAVAHAAADELRPGRDGGHRVRLLGEEAPERGVVPAERVPRAVAVGADAPAELLDLGDELVAGHVVEVGVHGSIMRDPRTDTSSGSCGAADQGA